MKKTPQGMLREFHHKYGHLITDSPTTEIPMPVKQLRMALIDEEHQELKEAIMTDNLSEIADGCADLVYVVIGTCISYGIPFDRVFQEVHNSNMTKTGVKVTDAAAGSKYGTKTPKGPDFKPPRIDRILSEPGLETELEVIQLKAECDEIATRERNYLRDSGDFI